MHHVRQLPNPFIPAMHQHLVQWPVRTSGKNADGTRYYVPIDLSATQAERKLWKLGDDGDRYHRSKILRGLPQSVGNAVATVYKDMYRSDNSKKGEAVKRQRANRYLTDIYNRHLSKKMAVLCQNPLIFKPSDMIVDDEYLNMTFGIAPELKSLNKKAKNVHDNYLLDLLEYWQESELMPVKRTKEESEPSVVYHEDGTTTIKTAQSDNHKSSSHDLQNFWNRSDNELRDYAFDMVRMVYQFLQRLVIAGRDHYAENDLLKRIYQVVCAIPNQMGIREKYQDISIEKFTTEHADIGLARLLCEKWWLRKLRKVHRQKHEEIAIACGVVHSGTQCYVSNDTYKYFERRQQESLKVLGDMVAYNEESDQEVPLLSLIEKSVSNPKIRRHELMTRMRGCEDFAKEQDHVGLFITLTAPSKCHPTSSRKLKGEKSIIANPKYNGVTPDETNRYLNNVFARIRSALDKLNIKPYGFRVVEPHEDETPHQHYMLFCTDKQKQTIIDMFYHYGLQIDGNEAGAKKHRVTVVKMDPKKGSATGYIAKYISKNIDGYQTDGKEIGEDNYGNSAAEAAKRITAWRKCWGIRAFQAFGQPSVSIWRELRKFNSEDAGQWREKLNTEKTGTYNSHVIAWLNHTRPVKACENDEIEKCRFWADTGKWDKFIQEMGGVNTKRDHRPVWLLKPNEPVINRYNEAVPHKAIGVESITGSIITSDKTWTLHRKGESPKRIALDALKAARSGASSFDSALSAAGTAQPWSAVNNCTDSTLEQPNKPEEPAFTPMFAYPKPPGYHEAKEYMGEISEEDQELADFLMLRKPSPITKGLIKSLKEGKTIPRGRNKGLKIVEYENGEKHLTQTHVTDPNDDWFIEEEEPFDPNKPIFTAESGLKIINGKLHIGTAA